MPAAPATQPRPNSGTRFTSGRSPTRAAIRASRDGTARPVTVAETIRSTSVGVRSAALSASCSARAPSSTACSMNRSLAVVKPSSSPYCSRGSTVCRNSTPELAWNRRSSRSSSPPPRAMTPANASVISACECRCAGSAPRTVRSCMSSGPPCRATPHGPLHTNCARTCIQRAVLSIVVMGWFVRSAGG